jgi:hypothetical protein
MYKTHLQVRFTTNSEFRRFMKVVKVSDTSHTKPEQTSTEYIGITVDGIFRRKASSGREDSTFKVNIKQTKISKTSIWHE